jgi:hypothetical protein
MSRFTITQYNKQVLTKNIARNAIKKLALSGHTVLKDEYIHFNSELIFFVRLINL